MGAREARGPGGRGGDTHPPRLGAAPGLWVGLSLICHGAYRCGQGVKAKPTYVYLLRSSCKIQTPFRLDTLCHTYQELQVRVQLHSCTK